MKGKILKTDEGWVVEIQSDLHGYGIGWGNSRIYPLFITNENIWIGKEVEVEPIKYNGDTFEPVLVKIKDMQPKESKSSRHFKISVLKSGIRMFGCAALMYGSFFISGCLFFIAECFGVIEEL